MSEKGRSERPQNRTDATPCLSDVYNIGTRARRRTVNIILPGQTFLRRVLQIRRDFLTTCTQKSTRGKKSQVDVALCGRSMVEMLGVLAIIGVLSVGAISGYSKAMFKYKLNRQAEQLHSLISAVIIHPEAKQTTSFSVLKYLRTIGVIPPEMLPQNYNDTTDRIYDVFNNTIQFHINNEKFFSLFIHLLTNKSRQNYEICQNVLAIAKEYHQDLAYVELIDSNGADIFKVVVQYYGDKLCTGSRKCITDLTMTKISDFCSKAEEDMENLSLRIWI